MMKPEIVEEKYDTLKILGKRFELLFGARLRHRDKILRAVENLEKLREKLSAQVGSFNGVAEIRKWREE